MSGRRVLFACWATLVLLASACGGERRPTSVVLVVVDTWRADHLGFHGYERATTAELAPWLERAALFEQAIATAGWTLPSFGSLFTGHIPSRHAAGLLLEAGEKPKFALLDASVRSLGENFSRAGFATAGVAN